MTDLHSYFQLTKTTDLS